MPLTRTQFAIARHAARILQLDGREIRYLIGNSVVFEGQKGVPVEEMYRVNDGHGGYTLTRSTDWIVKRELFANADPRPGGILETRDENGTLDRFEVMPIDGEPCFRDYDTDSHLLLLHTNRLTE